MPLVLAVGGFWLTRSENRYAFQLQDRREQDAVLKDYLDQMTQLLLERGLRKSAEDAEVRNVARARTLTALRRVSGEGKGSIIQFLHEGNLIQHSQDRSPLVLLKDGDLSGAELHKANLAEANLAGANLSGAKLNRANLDGANLDGANLEGASLGGATLLEANLRAASLSGTYLREANLKRANLLGADLFVADLFGAKLAGANLSGANFNWARLELADLKDVILQGANLIECRVTREQLLSAKSLAGAKLPPKLADLETPAES